ncbi:hypothetical protein P879_10060 [Paragonimus westermani]|uniref:Uncharacterized protein n=1 Tax=Paragonimus westermani TaxID=34504 RepID=A0A8T0DJW6_9TREM|nr:hypothetical protein P879_10060 [Paragonimus westermani]
MSFLPVQREYTSHTTICSTFCFELSW